MLCHTSYVNAPTHDFYAHITLSQAAPLQILKGLLSLSLHHSPVPSSAPANAAPAASHVTAALCHEFSLSLPCCLYPHWCAVSLKQPNAVGSTVAGSHGERAVAPLYIRWARKGRILLFVPVSIPCTGRGLSITVGSTLNGFDSPPWHTMWPSTPVVGRARERNEGPNA